MKRMKYIILSIIALTIVSCVKEDFGGKDTLTSFSQVTVGMADLATTRTHLGDNNEVLWDEWENIGIYSDIQDVELYTLNQSDGGNASFSGNAVKGSKFYAYYPFATITKGENNLLHTSMNEVYINNVTSLPMVATSSNNTFLFKQVMGMIKLTLYGNSHITSLFIHGNKDELIAGEGYIDLNEQTPLFVIDNNSDNNTTYISIHDYQLKDGEPNVFYFPIPVMTFENGFTLTISGTRANSGEKYYIEKTIDDPVVISRAMIKSFTGLDTDAIIQAEADQLLLEREALIDLYNSTDGANWTNHENWGSDKPLNEWYGIQTDAQGHVTNIGLPSNNLKGTIPASIGVFSKLKDLGLMTNSLSGSIPETIGNLSNLEYLQLYSNSLSGELPASICNLIHLSHIDLSNNNISGIIPENIGILNKVTYFGVYLNQISGNIPESIGNMSLLEYLMLSENKLEGVIPNSISKLESLKGIDLGGNLFTGEIPTWFEKLPQLTSLNLNNCQFSGNIPQEIGNITTLCILDLSKNKLTGSIPESICNLSHLTQLDLSNNQLTGSIPSSIGNLTELTALIIEYNKLTGSIPESICNLTKLRDFWANENQLTGIIPENIGNTDLYTFEIDNNKITGSIPESFSDCPRLHYLNLCANQLTGTIPDSFIKLKNLNYINVYHNKMDGIISADLVYSGFFYNLTYFYYEQLPGYELKFGEAYTSTDFSRDGEINVLQRHTKGNGISIVIIGDAFSDRLINDGTYDKYAKEMMEGFFSHEPYTSFRDYFDVYYVVAVSKNEILGQDTAMETQGGGTVYEVNVEKAVDYILTVPELNGTITNVTAIVMIRQLMSGGLQNCLRLDDGFSVSALIAGTDKNIITHETGGHGFGKLEDEYWYENDDPFTEDKIIIVDDLHQRGESLNVDYRNDPTTVSWASFIANQDYSVEGIGIYEGAANFISGFYRPTENSIMRTSSNPDYDGGFNAPSRWAIYQRIMKLAGEDYSFESFLEYDKKNLEAIAAKATTRNYVEKPVASKTQLGAPPVFYNYPSSEIGKH